MAEAPSQGQEVSTAEAEEEFTDGNLVLPEDGYAWKKYGQKFIKNIGRIRSYFKCQRSGCAAKKRAEWLHSDPSNPRVIYEGNHSHSSMADQESSSSSHEASSSSIASRYNLVNQVFGAPRNQNPN